MTIEMLKQPKEVTEQPIEQVEITEQEDVVVTEESTEQEDVAEQKDDSSNVESVSSSTSISVNVGKTSRKIAAEKTKAQLQAVMTEIRSDMQQVKAGIEINVCDQSELNKVNSLMNMAQTKMDSVQDRKATAEEQTDFAMSLIM